jgi:hypothetical protein
MPIAFRSAGASVKANIGVSPTWQVVPMPPGHQAGDLLLIVLAYDSNTGPATPAGWTLLSKASAGQTPSGASYSRVQTRVYYRVATSGSTSGALFTFSREPWPTGSPYVLGFAVAYSGVDPAGPIEKFAAVGTAGTASSQTHPQLTTVADGDWLLTLRTGSAWGARSTTIAGGTNTKRVDDNDGMGELFASLYDSDSTITPGAQAVRATFATGGDGLCAGGSTMWSVALKPVTVAAFALPGSAAVSATANSPTVVTQPGGWDLCGEQGLPRYRFAIDWSGDGTIGDTEAVGAAYAADTFGRSVTGGWGTADSGQAWSTGSIASNFSVNGSAGVHAVSTRSASRFSTVPASSPDTDLRVTFSVDQTAASDSMYVYLMARHTDANNFYFVRVQMASTGAVVPTLRKRVGGTEVVLATGATGLTHAAGAAYAVRLRVAGNRLLAKVWPAGSAEPGWQVSATDPDLTAAGAVGVRTLLGGSTTNTLPVTFLFDDFTASFTADTEDVTGDIVSDVSVSYGRDQERQLSPAAVGSAGFTVNNTSRRYSPENTGSPLYGDLDPARLMGGSVTFNGQTYPLFTGRTDDYNVHADFADRTAEFTFLDGLNDLAGVKLSTAVYTSMRTGDLVRAVLDLAGWTGGRDIDPGASVVRYWWLEGTDALSAINDLVKSEGPPAVAYVAPDGTFVFRDRHHRLLRQASLTSRATFTAGRLGDCAAGAPAEGYDFTKPFTYAHGWRDIVNVVAFDVEERSPAPVLEAVWSDESTYSLAPGQSVDVAVNVSEPFVGAVLPVLGTDVTYFSSGGGVPSLQLDRRSGASATLTVRAVGGPLEVTRLQLRARSLGVQRTVRVSMTDPGSVGRHGERSYPDSAPWASPADAEAIAGMILLHYARRRPTVQLRITSSDPAHFMQVVRRTVSDRVRIVNEEMGLDADFFVERVAHSIQRFNRAGQPPVHSVVLGCERDLLVPENVFTFDQRGAGFDQGVFDLTVADAADEVFVFDDPVQGQFDVGKLGT